MNRRKGLFVLQVEDGYLNTLEDLPHEGVPEEGRMLRLWKNLLTAADQHGGPEIIDNTAQYLPVMQLILEQMAKGEKDYSAYYDGDFNENIWSHLSGRTNIRVDRPIRVLLSFVLNELFIDFRRDSRQSNLYVHNLLRLIAQMPIFDIEVYQPEHESDTALFSYEATFNGLGICENGHLEGLYFSQNELLGQLALEELQAAFSRREKIMLVKEQFMDFLELLRETDEQLPSYAHIPYIYLYMASPRLREKMYLEHAIDRTEYELWGMFHAFLMDEHIYNSRFLIAAKAISDVYEQGYVKVHGGIMDLGKYKQDFLMDMDRAQRFLLEKGCLIRDSSAASALEIPDIMIYSNPKRTLLSRTNVNKRYCLERVANEVTGTKLAGAIYHYFDSICRGDISLPPTRYAVM